jgi:DNA-binding CsgD family transcriptional regulator/GAF domain-containing protein
MDHAADLIRATYEGVFEDPFWSTLLAEVRRLTGASYVSFAFQRPDARRISEVRVMYSGETQPELRPEALEALYRRSPLPYHRLEPGRVYALDEFLDPEDEVHQAYRAYLSGRALNFNRVIRVTEPSGGNGWLGVSRGDSDFPPEVRALLEAIAPHLSTAVRMLAALEQEKVRSDILSDAIRRLNLGWLTLDRKGRVVETSPAAAEVFRRTPGLGVLENGGQLRLPEAARIALRKTLADFMDAPGARPRAIHLLDEPWLDMLLVHTQVSTMSGAANPIATGYIHGERTPSADSFAQLKEVYALTNSEARLALALSQGATLSEAAGQMGVTVQTARYYSKCIYSKTRTRNQADLVRLVLSSVIALA